MAIYPQLSTGAISQFPLQKTRRRRTVVNAAADGTTVKLADPAGETVEWQLQYAGLSDAELASLQQFFTESEGSLNGFTFLDPAGNLLSWSDHFDTAAWSTGPFLSVTGGEADPRGGLNAWRLANAGAGAQSISQTLGVPGGYLYCLSAYARSDQPVTVTLLLGASRADRVVNTVWSRISLATTGDPAASTVLFGLEAPAGAVIDLFGMQVEPQAAASVYTPSTTGGVYENSRFRDDSFSFTSSAPNCHSATVNIIHASHL